MEMNLQKQEIRGRRQDMLNPAFGNGKPFGGGRMGNLIQSGTLLIKRGTVVPESITFERRPCLKGWIIVQGLSASGLDR